MKYTVPMIYSFILGVVLFVNYLSNALPINGKTTGELSDNYDSMITPAPFAFSIWGIIYLVLLGWIISLWIKYKNDDFPAQIEAKSILTLFSFNALLNITWLLTWHFEQIILSVFIMLSLLLSLILIYRKAIQFDQLWKFPWSIYLGWISVATIVNVSVLFIYLDIGFLLEQARMWTFIMSTIAGLLGIYFLLFKRDPYFTVVIVWALFFVALANQRDGGLYFYQNGFVILIILLFFVRKKVVFFNNINQK